MRDYHPAAATFRALRGFPGFQEDFLPERKSKQVVTVKADIPWRSWSLNNHGHPPPDSLDRSAGPTDRPLSLPLHASL